MALRATLPDPPVKATRHTFGVLCKRCLKKTNMTVNSDDYRHWKEGMNVQIAFPYLNSRYHELLINEICADCTDAEVSSSKEDPDR